MAPKTYRTALRVRIHTTIKNDLKTRIKEWPSHFRQTKKKKIKNYLGVDCPDVLKANELVQ
jgi:hypothetical protein